MRNYLKQRAADGLLCLCLSAAMTPVICSGFVLTDPWSGNVAVIFALCALVQMVLLLIARSRLSAGIGIAVGAVLAIGAAVYCRTSDPFAEEGSNSGFIFLLVLVVTCVLVFLLGRTRVGIAALFLLGSIVQAGSHFLQFPTPLWSLLLFLAALPILFFYRTYLISAARADLGTVRSWKYLRQVLLVCLAAILVAGGLYAGVVRPLNPPTQELKLITMLKSMDQLKVLGVSTVDIVLDPEDRSEQPPEEEDQAGDEGEDESDDLGEESPPLSELPEEQDQQRQNTDSDRQQLWSGIRYDETVLSYLWLLLLIPVLIVGAFVLRYLLRRRWREKVRALPREEAVVNYYQFFLKRLARAGLKRAKQHTLREYADNTKVQLEPFGAGRGAFGDLTATYEKVLYGRCPVSEEEYQRFETFYDSFYRCLRKEAGAVKYWLTAWRY